MVAFVKLSQNTRSKASDAPAWNCTGAKEKLIGKYFVCFDTLNDFDSINQGVTFHIQKSINSNRFQMRIYAVWSGRKNLVYTQSKLFLFTYISTH